MADVSGSVDFFVSYTGSDVGWARWLGWELERAGYRIVLQAWDVRPGHDFVHEMHEAMQRAQRTIAVLSPAYLGSAEFGEAKWRGRFDEDPSGRLRSLIPVRVAECTPTGLLTTRVHIDLVDRSESAARQALLDGVREGDGRPATAPGFPGNRTAGRSGAGREPGRPRFPGALPPVCRCLSPPIRCSPPRG